jgi:hypothetical protein
VRRPTEGTAGGSGCGGVGHGGLLVWQEFCVTEVRGDGSDQPGVLPEYVGLGLADDRNGETHSFDTSFDTSDDA